MTLFQLAERGSREIRLLHLGRAHTGGDVVIFLPRERVNHNLGEAEGTGQARSGTSETERQLEQAEPVWRHLRSTARWPSMLRRWRSCALTPQPASLSF